MPVFSLQQLLPMQLMAMASSSALHSSSASPRLSPLRASPSTPHRFPPPRHKLASSTWRDSPSRATLRFLIRDQDLLPRHVPWQFFSQLDTGGLNVNSNSMSSEHDKNNENGGHTTSISGVKEITDEEFDDKGADTKGINDHQMVRVCDKLIDVFLVDKPHTADWRRLLAFSREWVNIRPHFYKHCLEKAEAENEPSMKQALLRLARKLREVDEDIERHNELLAAIKEASPDINDLLVKRRKDFTREFFEHFHAVVGSYHDSPTEQKALLELQSMCLAAIEAFDKASEGIDLLNDAKLKFEDIITSPTLYDACRKIDTLAEKKQLNSALMLMLTKAWSAAKESSLTKTEAKDILFHLYMTGMKNLETQVSKETRILKHLLAIKDPEELMSNLNDAFTPGTSDSLYTTPNELFAWIQIIIDVYNRSKQGTPLGEARDLMNPTLIRRLEELQKIIRDKFM